MTNDVSSVEEMQTAVKRVLAMHLELWEEKQVAYAQLERALATRDHTALSEATQIIRGEQRLVRLITPKTNDMKKAVHNAQETITNRLKTLPKRPATPEDHAKEVALTSMKDVATRLEAIAIQAKKYFPFLEQRTEKELQLMTIINESTLHELNTKSISTSLKALNKLFAEDEKERKKLIVKTMDAGLLRQAIEQLKTTKPLRLAWQGALISGVGLSSYSIGRGEFEASQNIAGITGVGLIVSGAVMLGTYFFEYSRRMQEHAVVRLREEMANT